MRTIKLMFFCCLGLIAMPGCGNSSSKASDEGENVDLLPMAGNVAESVDGEMDYILLDTCASSGIAWVDKVMVSADNSLWVMDQRRKTLAEYDRSGKWIKSLNKFGQGPEEYLNLNDFEVSGNGYIYIVDGRLDKIMVYDKDLLFKRSAKPEFESDAIHLLPNGNIAFGLSSWDKKYGEEWKVVVCDSTMTPVDFLIPGTLSV